jgi:hypothetical protein
MGGGEVGVLTPWRTPPPDPGEKWNAIKDALSDKEKTRRLIRLMLVNYLPEVLAGIVVISLALIAAVLR